MSASPLIKITDRIALLPPQYLGSTLYYAALAQYKHVAIANYLRYDKRFKSVHRCLIADTQGTLQLTVPISKDTSTPHGKRCWCDVMVSSHAQWWSDHIVSLESAYGRTPFFEFYFDRFRPWLSDNHLPITELDKKLDQEIRRILALETIVDYLDEPMLLADQPLSLPPQATYDAPSQPTHHGLLLPPYPGIHAVEYYQVRKYRLGFIPDLSILDLIFNMGPEAPLILHRMAMSQQ